MEEFEREKRVFFHTYKRIPLEIDRGDGVYLIARDGRRYLDMFSGLAVNALGYGNPKLIDAIAEQASKYIHLSNYYLQEPQIALAELLTRSSGYSRVFFSNSGTESIEGALKIARRWGSERDKTDILSFSNAFHGRTMGALSLMDRDGYRKGFGPFLPHCCMIPFNDTEALRRSVSEKTAGVILEFIQGEGGIQPVSREFVDELARLKQRFDFLLIADEIQSGIGRTGKFFAFQHYSIRPDIVVVAKPLGGGLPLGAILATSELESVLEPGAHGTTFGGNPVACAAGLVVLRAIAEEGVMEQAARSGRILRDHLAGLQKEFPQIVKEIRGFGLMIGMELSVECDPIVKELRNRGILLNCTSQTVLRFLPPLIVDEEHIVETVRELRKIFRELSNR